MERDGLFDFEFSLLLYDANFNSGTISSSSSLVENGMVRRREGINLLNTNLEAIGLVES